MEKRVHDGPYKTSNNHLKKRAQRGANPSDLNLPEPTFPIVDQKKKSHAKKQPEGHIPRPKNAFILFRCYFVGEKKIPKSVENDHRNISRIIGKIWQQMSAEEKEPWRQKAEQEKIDHHKKYPNYKFASGPSKRKKSKRGDDRRAKEEPTMKEEELNVALGRASSCPPGAQVVQQAMFENCAPAYGDPLRTRDDLSRRPSRVVFYRSAPYDLTANSHQPGFFDDSANQHYFAQALSRNETISCPPAEELCPSETGDNVGNFCGPRMGNSHYPIPDHNTPPEWENDLLVSTIDELYPSPLRDSGSLHDDHITIPESTFTDPFRSTLPPLPRSGGSEMSLDSLDSLPSPESYHGHSSKAHEQDMPVLEGTQNQQPLSVNELSEDIISEFSRNLQMVPIGHSDKTQRP